MIGIDDLAEMARCRSELEDVLQRLDAIGAGIAAIHVDAAIAQLRGNIETEADSPRSEGLDPSLMGSYAFPLTRH